MSSQITDDVNTALKKLRLHINGIRPWEKATNRTAMVGILQAASLSKKPNIDNIYPHLISKLTKKECKTMPNFIGQLRRSGLVSPGPNRLQWQSKLTVSKEQLHELWDKISKD